MRNATRVGRSICVAGWAFAALLAFGFAGVAQEKGNPKDALPKEGVGQQDAVLPGNQPQVGFFEFGQGIRISAAMQMIAIPNPIVVAINRVAAARHGETGPLLFPEWDLTLDAPLPLTTKWLHEIQDGTPIPNMAVPIPWHERKVEERAYIQLQYEALIDSKLVSDELFKKAGEENRFVAT